MDTIIMTFVGLYNDANECMSRYDDGNRLNTTNNNASDHPLCNHCAILYKNVSDYFNKEIVKKAKTKKNICLAILERVSSIISLNHKKLMV